MQFPMIPADVAEHECGPAIAVRPTQPLVLPAYPRLYAVRSVRSDYSNPGSAWDVFCSACLPVAQDGEHVLSLGSRSGHHCCQCGC
jgi:hypothetical protein